ncbi:hypothetical protein [Chryseobacterium sp. Leaf394]|uniref:hypothetical protein n=1 Tax=Chryseobacterium sp. Leaf394 TaxID=1736361 RepID=UPI0007018940|nr:hypothetical protein [Chryseobacterium sp. Leaf394]KQS93035.1 hypothetical protein ASG21_11570 [Chryseobacterium sp. Leaf394]
MNAVITLSVFLIFLFSCKKEKVASAENIPVSEKNLNKKTLDSLRSQSIFVQENENILTRIWVKSNEKRGNYFYSDTLNVLKISKYQFAGQKLNLIKEINLEKAEWSYLEIDSTNIKTRKTGKKNYLFLTHQVSNTGKAMRVISVNFSMINLDNIVDNFSLQYFGYPSDYCNGCIRGNFGENSKLKSSAFAKTVLHQYARTSKFIYHPSDEEKNITHYKNFGEKWEKDNATDNNFGAGYAIIPDIIYSTYYDENLFKLTSASEEFVENENYKVQSVFRGNLVGFDKKKRKYFPIIVESCSHFCNKNIEFVDAQKLKITYEDDQSFEINLNKIVFK